MGYGGVRFLFFYPAALRPEIIEESLGKVVDENVYLEKGQRNGKSSTVEGDGMGPNGISFLWLSYFVEYQRDVANDMAIRAL